MPRVLIVNHSSDPRSNVLWREVLRRYPTTSLLLPDLNDSTSQSDWHTEFDPSRVRFLPAHEPVGKGHAALWLRGLGNLLRHGAFDLVHMAVEPWALMAQAYCRRFPVVLQGAETRLSGVPWKTRIRRTGLRRVLRNATGISAWGQLSLEAFTREGIPRSTPTAVLPMGIPDPEIFAPSPVIHDSEEFRVLFVGRLAPEKGTSTLIEAVNRHPGPTTLRVLGDGPERGRLENAFVVGPSKKIIFEGTRPVHEVASAIGWAHVVVVPSQSTPTWEEQWGRSAVEAMLSGRPTVVSDSGELPHLIHDESLVFRQGDSAQLASIFHTLDGRRTDLSRIGDRIRGHAVKFLPEVVAQDAWNFWLVCHHHANSGGRRRTAALHN